MVITYTKDGNPVNSNIEIVEGGDNCVIENDNLVLKTITKDGKTTLAKSVSTAGKMKFRYGRLEMRAKVPYIQGAWPSFWLRSDYDSNDKTPFGEIDIFEIYGTKNAAENSSLGIGSSNIHKWRMPVASDISSTCNFANSNNKTFLGGTTGTGFEFNPDVYHIFAMEWTPQYIAFYVDDYLYSKIDICNSDFCTCDADGDNQFDHIGMDCFNEYYFICLNNWVFNGINQPWKGYEDQCLENIEDGVNADYYIDYIRLYQDPLAGETISFE